ncbi:MAG TPA: histidine kinase, partial [Flavobacteriaceae bacterium]|nr:histidine kinase [Flavobacteriaceae bacterium]
MSYFLNIQPVSDLLKYPNDNGIVLFVLGILFVLTVYHFLLYFQHKDKVYLYYSLYTFLIFIGHLDDSTTDFVYTLIKPVRYYLREYNINITWTYNLLYFVFAFTFIDIKPYSKKWHQFIFRSVLILFIISIFIEIGYQVTKNIQFIRKGDLFFVISISLLAILSYIPIFKVKNPLKYYIIVGSVFLFSTSLIATIIYKLKLTSPENEIRFSIFYIGLVLENILFSLGLGHKQKLILKEKNETKENLIRQLQENEKLQKKVEKQLQKDIENLNKQAEIDRLEKLQERNNKELAELKLSSLRSQMNPHFIFNSLNSIKRYIIDNKKENAVYYLNKFSKLIRNVLATTREKEISLANEIETLELYLNIENIRFDNQINFNLSVDEDLNLETIKIPSLILQPFIENAIWHG